MNPVRNLLSVLIAVLMLSLAPVTVLASSGGGTAKSQSTTPTTTPTPSDEAVSAVPEPGALLLFAAGAIVVGAAIRRKRS